MRSRALFIVGVISATATVACARMPTTAPTASLTPAPQAEPVTLTYLGVAGWQLVASSKVLLIDPYFSRVAVENGAAPIVPDIGAIARYAPEHVDFILIGHSHYDHLLDAPTIAAKTGAWLIGTESTIHVARAAGLAEQRLRTVRAGEAFVIAPFSVRAKRGLHSLTGATSAPIAAGVTLPMAADAYTEGGTLQYFVETNGRSVLFIGSANFIESELDGLRPDVAVIAVGLREKIPDYACRLMRALGRPRLVLANHFDAHWAPLGVKQMDIGDDARNKLASFADEIHACAPATNVTVPAHFGAIAL